MDKEDYKCKCGDGFTGEDCGWKKCPNDCNAQHGSCKLTTSQEGEKVSKCICEDGWTGADCMSKACNGCVNGVCTTVSVKNSTDGVEKNGR